MSQTIPEPTEGSLVNSYELCLDINTGTAEAPVWTNIPDVTGIAPQGTPRMIDDSTYAHKGQNSQSKVGEEFTIDFQVSGIRDLAGEYQSYLVALLAYAAPETRGNAAVAQFRYYDELGASYAFEFSGTIQETRTNTGNADPGFFSFTVTSKGDRKSIANPNRLGVPTITAATPASAVEGANVTITGTNFTGATSVKFGAVEAVMFNVNSATEILADMPAGVAGSAPITVTTPGGASAPFAYTRG